MMGRAASSAGARGSAAGKVKKLAAKGAPDIRTFFAAKSVTSGDTDTTSATTTTTATTTVASTALPQPAAAAAAAAAATAAAAQPSLPDDVNRLLVGVGPEWQRALAAQFKLDYFAKLARFVLAERAKNTVYPPAGDVFAWTRSSAPQNLRVFILGQDPYHQPGQAHGLCFSVRKGVRPPPSLANIYKELEKDVPGFAKPAHGFLESWAAQGVLMLNAVLTVRQSAANSHKDKGWERFTDAVIERVSAEQQGVVFMLWGGYAQKKGKRIDAGKHLVLKCAHPSPLSANRGGWFGNRHFSQANEYLASQGKEPIDWTSICEK